MTELDLNGPIAARDGTLVVELTNVGWPKTRPLRGILGGVKRSWNADGRYLGEFEHPFDLHRVASTPAATWREKHQGDPHGTHYARERATLAGGHMTDDELANHVFMDGLGEPGIMPGIDAPFGRTMRLTMAKDRIRWLSRALVAETTARARLEEALRGLVLACERSMDETDLGDRLVDARRVLAETTGVAS